jgi:hypothetical protein
MDTSLSITISEVPIRDKKWNYLDFFLTRAKAIGIYDLKCYYLLFYGHVVVGTPSIEVQTRLTTRIVQSVVLADSIGEITD